MSYSMAFTIPEEDRENYVTEEEASHMIKGFNSHLRNFSVQVDELHKQNTHLEQKLEKEQERNNGLRQLISTTKVKFVDFESEANKKFQILLDLEAKIESESLKTLSSCGVNSSDFEYNPMSVQSSDTIQSEIQVLLDYLSKLEATSIMLQTQEELMNKKIIENNESLNSEVKCANCKENYIPIKNYHSACRFHCGKLKYFSCRGCGADPYYDCCNKCKECSAGCKVGHHTS